MSRLNRKVALASAVSHGIGAAVACALVEESAKVVLGTLVNDAGMAMVKKAGRLDRHVHLDVTSPVGWWKADATAIETYNKVNKLVHETGIALHGAIEVVNRDGSGAPCGPYGALRNEDHAARRDY
jgi:3alpha(or 20beta)-hydroxysteroid dehydrogenase